MADRPDVRIVWVSDSSRTDGSPLIEMAISADPAPVEHGELTRPERRQRRPAGSIRRVTESRVSTRRATTR